MQRILVVGGGHPQLTLIEESVKLGCHVTVVDDRANCPGVRLSSVVLPIHRYDTEAVVAAARKLPFEGVVSGGSDKAVWVMAKVANACGLTPYVTADTAALPMAKDRMRTFLDDHALPVPTSKRVDSLAEALEAADQCHYPVVIKPVDGIGQLGVHRVDGPESLRRVFPESVQASGSSSVLLQEFVEGRELGVNGFVMDGAFRLLTVSYRDASRDEGDAFGVALYKQYPAIEARPHFGLIESVLDRACRAMGLINSPIYAQIMLRNQAADPIRVIEVMPRIGGGEDPRLVHAATGFNMAKATVKVALGQALATSDLVDGPGHPAVSLRFLTAQAGRISGIYGLPDARAAPGVINADAFYGIGHRVDGVRSSRERLGYVLTVGDTVEQSTERARTAAGLIGIVTE